jgi:hypothetical protein
VILLVTIFSGITVMTLSEKAHQRIIFDIWLFKRDKLDLNITGSFLYIDYYNQILKISNTRNSNFYDFFEKCFKQKIAFHVLTRTEKLFFANFMLSGRKNMFKVRLIRWLTSSHQSRL